MAKVSICYCTLASAANLVMSFRTNLSQARAAFMSAMIHSENQIQAQFFFQLVCYRMLDMVSHNICTGHS